MATRLSPIASNKTFIVIIINSSSNSSDERQRQATAHNLIALWGQSRWRGIKGRQYGLPYLKNGRAELRRMYRVKKKEDITRKTVVWS